MQEALKAAYKQTLLIGNCFKSYYFFLSIGI